MTVHGVKNNKDIYIFFFYIHITDILIAIHLTISFFFKFSKKMRTMNFYFPLIKINLCKGVQRSLILSTPWSMSTFVGLNYKQCGIYHLKEIRAKRNPK